MQNYSRPLVSVCMITYNHEAFIEEAVTSILMQIGDFDLELIIADDASVDNTDDIVATIIESHPNGQAINYTKHTKNKGMMSNFLWALKQCKGDYIALCDGDDYWTSSNKLQKQIEFLEDNRDYTLCFHPCYFLDKSKELNPQNIALIEYEYTVQNLLSRWAIPTASMVFRATDIFSKIPDWLNDIHSGDIAITLLNFEEGKFKLLKEHLSVYRLHGAGVSEFHKGARMIDYRTFLYWNLNQYFDHKYENEIYEALHNVMQKFMPQLNKEKKELSTQELMSKVKNKLTKKLSKRD